MESENLKSLRINREMHRQQPGLLAVILVLPWKVGGENSWAPFFPLPRCSTMPSLRRSASPA